MKCIYCNSENSIGSSFCVNCGAQLENKTEPTNNNQNLNMQSNTSEQQYQRPYSTTPVDTGSFGWAVLGFFFPIVGLILYLCWKPTKPFSAEKAKNGAIAGFCFNIIKIFL